MESAYLYSAAEQSEFINSCLAKLKPKGRSKKEKKTQHERTHSLPPPITRKAMSDPILTTRHLHQPLPSPLSVRAPVKPESKAFKVLGIEPNTTPSAKSSLDIEPKAQAARVLRYRVNGMTITVEKDTSSNRVPVQTPETSTQRNPVDDDSQHYSLTSVEASEILESVGWRIEAKEKVMQSWTDWVDMLMQGKESPKGGDSDWRESWEEDDLDVEDLKEWLESYGCKMTPMPATEGGDEDDDMDDIPIALG